MPYRFFFALPATFFLPPAFAFGWEADFFLATGWLAFLAGFFAAAFFGAAFRAA